jgi:hypothetical protein
VSIDTEVVNNRLQAAGPDVDRRQRDRKLEAASTCASRVDIEHSVDRLDLGSVRVARDDDVDAVLGRIDLQGIQVVQHIDRNAHEFRQFGVGEFFCPIAFVYVAPYRGDGSDPAERRNNVGGAYVAAVDDVIDASKATLCFRTQ